MINLEMIRNIAIILCNVAIVIGIVMLFYSIYQLIRNNKVYDIRKKWIDAYDDRHDKYSYKYMMDANRHNWFGLRFPRDRHY